MAKAALKRSHPPPPPKRQASGGGESTEREATATLIRRRLAGPRAGATAFTVLADVLLHFSPECMRLAHPIGDAQGLLRSIMAEEVGVAAAAAVAAQRAAAGAGADN